MATSMTMVDTGQSCVSPLTKHNPDCAPGELFAAAASTGKEEGAGMEVDDQEEKNEESTEA